MTCPISKRSLFLFIFCLITGGISLPSDAQAYITNWLFRIECDPASNALVISELGVPLYRLSSAQIAVPLYTAINTQQNQPIITDERTSVWALKSNELQVHLNEDAENTKLISPSNICGTIPAPYAPDSNVPTNSRALAYAEAQIGGEALAIAQVTATGEVIAIAWVRGPGVAAAFAESLGGTAPTPTGARFHVVQEGENLYRIALTYGTTVEELTRINGLADPTLIYIGQIIYLP